MFIERLSSNDQRFKTLSFQDGLNILVADRTNSSVQGDSRNGTGKSSLIRILRYVLGGGLPDEFQAEALVDHSFEVVLNLPGVSAVEDRAFVRRSVKPTTRVAVSGWSRTGGEEDIHVDEWRAFLAEALFSIPSESQRPTVGQLWGQLIRTYYGKPTKSHSSEPDWETGVKLGHLLGLSAEVLSRAGELDALTKQRTAIKRAIRDGAIKHLSLDEASLRAQLISARRRRDRLREGLRSYKVDDQYREHQDSADQLSATIERLNDEGLGLQRRRRELLSVIETEVKAADAAEFTTRLSRIYAEVSVALPDQVTRRFEDVQAFHESVVRNRRMFLTAELQAAETRLAEIDAERADADAKRSVMMQLLSDSVALDTFLEAQRSLSEADSTVADLERRLESARSISEIDTNINIRTAETVGAVRAEIEERSESLETPIALFNELGSEIYSDRAASLLISPTPRGLLHVEPTVEGDASDGIRSVETFLIDMVCVVSAIRNGRAPPNLGPRQPPF